VAPAAAERSRAIVALEHASVAACLALAAGAAASLAARAAELSPAALALALPCGLAAADLGAGIFHWGCDRFGSRQTPVLGALIGPFRDHHERPAEIARRGFVELCGGTALGVAPGIALGCVWLESAARLPLGGFAPTAWLVFCLATVATNQLHAWAHGKRAPRAVAWLQRRGLLLSRSAHAAHHRGGQDCAYCITTGWLNPVLDGIFARLERVLQRP
jgi:ubiquitin-conjugating enzyme E2 variant